MSTEITFLDADNNIVDAARAVMVVETETDANGNVIRESWNRVVKTNPPRPKNPRLRWVLLVVIVILLGLLFASALFAS